MADSVRTTPMRRCSKHAFVRLVTLLSTHTAVSAPASCYFQWELKYEIVLTTAPLLPAPRTHARTSAPLITHHASRILQRLSRPQSIASCRVFRVQADPRSRERELEVM